MIFKQTASETGNTKYLGGASGATYERTKKDVFADFHPKAGELNSFLSEIGFTGNFTATPIESSDNQNLQVTLQDAQKPVVFNSSF